MSMVYVLDDNSDFGKTFKSMVISVGFECEFFTEVGSFVEATKQRPPDLFVVDMWLGQSNALDVFRANAPMFLGIPAILMSGGGGDVSLETVTAIADMEGFKEVLYKPFERSELKGLLGRYLSTS